MSLTRSRVGKIRPVLIVPFDRQRRRAFDIGPDLRLRDNRRRSQRRENKAPHCRQRPQRPFQKERQG